MIAISVIIPFYKGNKYLEELCQHLEKACIKFKEQIEVIIVNDSPDIDVNIELIKSDYYKLSIINHKINRGIHQARVTGTKAAIGKYILFLDQDDELDESFFQSMFYELENDTSIDFAFSNGIFEDENGVCKLILNSYGKVMAAMNYKSYLKVGNLLASPGQCLIRKKSIPKEWIQNIMKINCADDLLLWIMILKNGKNVYVNKLLYHHISTGENASSDKVNGYLSNLEMCEILEKTNLFSKQEVRKFKRKYANSYKKELNDCYNRFEWIGDTLSEKVERTKMKFAGIIFAMLGKKVVNIKEIG